MSLSDPSALRPFVDRLAARSSLDADERQALSNLPSWPAQLRTNHDFVRLGERVDHASFVVEGLIGRFGQNREGNRQITAVHIPSDMVNLHSVVEPEACSALQALSVATILKVPHSALRDVSRRYPAIAEAFWRECVIDASVLAEWVVNVGRRDARARLAHLLCEIACRMDGVGRLRGQRFDFPATQAHMADMLGLTSVHVNRTLRSLRGDGLILIESRTVTILDWPSLVDVGDFDPGYLSLPVGVRAREPGALVHPIERAPIATPLPVQ